MFQNPVFLPTCINKSTLPKVLPKPTEVSENEAMEAVQFGNMARSMPTMEEADAASAAP